MRDGLLVIFAAVCGIAAGRAASNGLVITETATTSINGRTTTSETVYTIENGRMRAQTTRGAAGRSVRIYDSTAGLLLLLDVEARRAERHDAARTVQQIERSLAADRIRVELEPSGAPRDRLGVACEPYAFIVKAPLAEDATLTMTGTAWIAWRSAGLDPYVRFYRAAGTILVAGSLDGPPGDVAISRAETELYRRIAGLGGMAYALEMRLAVEGGGAKAAALNKTLTRTRTVELTSVVETAPPVPQMFAIPSGWTIVNK